MTYIRPAGIPAGFPPPVPATRPAPAGEPTAAPAPQAAGSFLELLTPDERAFFAQLAAMGSLTYGPGAGDQPQAPTGQRIDVRA